MSNYSKQKGTLHEARTVDYLREHVDRRIERRALSGVHDRGDVSGVYAHGKPVVIECKSTGHLNVTQFLREAEAERGNADALLSCVVWKRPRISNDRRAPLEYMGDQLVIMTLRDLCALLTGERPDDCMGE